MGSISFVEENKKFLAGYDYRFKSDEKNCPDVITFTNPIMYYNLLRFGSIIFLDAMKGQLNEFSWPFITPVIRN